MNFDYILKDGLVIDGAGGGTKPFRSDIGIMGEHIASLGDLSKYRGHTVIDVKGLCVSPGFIDSHAHSDFTILADGRAEAKVFQGVTTEINGNCGLSAAPLYGRALEQREPELERLGIRERWSTFDEYFRILARRGTSLNFATLVGQGNLRSSVSGLENRELSSDELHRVLILLDESLHAGALGISAGLIYPPGIFTGTDELERCAMKASSRSGAVFTVHMRSEGDSLLEAVDEVVRIGQGAQINMHISHLKTSERRNWQKIDSLLMKISGARKNGLVLTCDRYPYTASSTGLDTVLPSWVYEGGRNEEIMTVRKRRKTIVQEILRDHPDGSLWENIIISRLNLDKNRWMEGETIRDISEKLAISPEETLLQVLIDENLDVDAIFFSMSEDNLIRILRQGYTAIGSDSSARCYDGVTAGGKPHPRGFGTFPRVLGLYARDHGVLSLPEAVYKMTGLPAGIFGLKERGVLKKGFFADITVFDPSTVSDRSDYRRPFQKPDGIYYVFVNGIPVMIEGALTGYLPGKILRLT